MSVQRLVYASLLALTANLWLIGASITWAEENAVVVDLGPASDELDIPAVFTDQTTTNSDISIDPNTGEHPVYHLRPEPYSDSDALSITLPELLALTLEYNLALRSQHLSIERDHYTVDKTYYAFDPQLSASLGYSRQNRGTTTSSSTSQDSLLAVASSRSDALSAGISYTVPREYGDAFVVNYDVSYSDTNTSDEAYSSGFSFGYQRPLGKGAGLFVNRIPRYLASNNLALACLSLDDQVRTLKKNVLDAYFQAVAARQSIDVREASLERALQQLERAVERYKVGLAIQAEVLQAENTVLAQRSALLTAQQTYASLLDQLTLLIGLPQEYRLTVDPDNALIELGEELPEDLWEMVRVNSYELASLNTQLANLRLTREQQRDQLKPGLDLNLSYGRSGNDNTLGLALTGYENESYQLGLNFSTTPGQRTTQAELAQTELDLASLDLKIQDTELQLKTALRGYQRDLATKLEQIKLAQKNAEVVEETYNIMVERRNVGLATTLDVIEAQEDVLSAELGLLEAQVTYHQAYREILLMAGLI